MTNFEFLLAYPQFNTFSATAVATEKIVHSDLATGLWNIL